MTHRDKPSKPWIIAHRGAMTEAPENTASAFDAALAYGVDGLELDVQLSSDGVIVIFHDGDLSRINGSQRRISDYSYEDLARMDWGGWHDEKFAGEPILTLDEALSRYGERTRLMIEIKSYERDRVLGRSYQLTMHVLETLERLVPAGNRANIFILSFDRDVLRLASEADVSWQYVLNVEDPSSILGDEHGFPEYLYGYGAPISETTRSFVDYVNGRGQRAMTWSCNTPAELNRALDAGTDVIMTDRPGWILDYMRARGLER